MTTLSRIGRLEAKHGFNGPGHLYYLVCGRTQDDRDSLIADARRAGTLGPNDLIESAPWTAEQDPPLPRWIGITTTLTNGEAKVIECRHESRWQAASERVGNRSTPDARREPDPHLASLTDNELDAAILRAERDECLRPDQLTSENDE